MTSQEMLLLDTALETMAEVYERKLTESLLALYHRLLGHVPLADILAACDTWLLSNSPFFPKPGQLLDLACPAPPPAADLLEARAEQAWQNLRSQARDYYNRWALEDPLTKEVWRTMGGGYITIHGFGRWEASEEQWKHREFVRLYCELASQQPDLPALPKPPALRLLPPHAEEA